MTSNAAFDVEVVRPCSRAPEDLALVLMVKYGNGEAWESRGFVGVELLLRDAQDLARLLENAGGSALVLPCRYRHPTISMEAARQIASQRLEVLRSEQGDIFGPLEDGQEQWMWWRFYAVHVPSMEREPGCIYIDIDKLDGHVKSDGDVEEYRRWQSGA